MSNSAPSQGELPLPAISQRMLRMILFLRGLCDRNGLGTNAAAWCTRRMLARLENEASPCQPDELPSLSWGAVEPAEFYARHVQLQRPVLLKGFPFRRDVWSIPSLIGKYGEHPATLIDDTGASFEGHIRDLNEASPSGGPFYMHNHFQLLRDVPELLSGLAMDQLAGLVRREAPNTIGLFASARFGTNSIMHAADNMNTFLLLEGRKRWTLVDPSYFLLTYPFFSHTNIFQLSLIRNAEVDESLPLFRYCPRYSVELEPGDCLLVPTWWYHSVRNLDSRTLALAVRWAPHRTGEVHPNALFRFLSLAARRVEPGERGIHQDSSHLVSTGLARSSWGLPALSGDAGFS